jgi:hypothetical protein
MVIGLFGNSCAIAPPTPNPSINAVAETAFIKDMRMVSSL